MTDAHRQAIAAIREEMWRRAGAPRTTVVVDGLPVPLPFGARVVRPDERRGDSITFRFFG